jgi:hypothetical protein
MMIVATNVGHGQALYQGDYFPLRLGNVWEYAVEAGTDVWSVVADSATPGERRVVWVREDQIRQGQEVKSGFRGYEVTSGDSIWTTFNDRPSFARHELPFVLTAPLGESWLVAADENLRAAVVKDTVQLHFGQERRVRIIDRWSVEPDSLWRSTHLFVDGIGCHLSVFEPAELSILVGARVDGRVYGQLSPSAAESDRGSTAPVKCRIVLMPGEIQVTMTSPRPGTCDLQIVNIRGQTVYAIGGCQVQAGNSVMRVPIPELSPGNYLIVLDGRDVDGTRALIVR